MKFTCDWQIFKGIKSSAEKIKLMVDFEILGIGIQERYLIRSEFSLYQLRTAIPKVHESYRQGQEPDKSSAVYANIRITSLKAPTIVQVWQCQIYHWYSVFLAT